MQLQQDRHDGFLDLALEILIQRQEEVAHQLLRDGAAALHDPAGADIGEHGAPDAAQRHAEMAVEMPVLDGDQALGKQLRHFLALEQQAILRPCRVDAADSQRIDAHQGVTARHSRLRDLADALAVEAHEEPSRRLVPVPVFELAADQIDGARRLAVGARALRLRDFAVTEAVEFPGERLGIDAEARVQLHGRGEDL